MYTLNQKYTDYNGVEREERFYFNLNKAEVVELELSKDGGTSEYLEKIIAAKDIREAIGYFKKLLLASYGTKTDDGKGFKKSAELRDQFESSAAYPEIYMLLATNAEEGAKFVNGIMPNFEAQQKSSIPAPANA